MIKAFFEGRLGADAQLKTSQNGAQFYSMRVATDDFKNGTNETTWVGVGINVERAGKMKFTKGSHVLVTGTLCASTYQSKSGEVGVSLDVMADSINYIKGSGQANSQEDGATSNENFGQLKKKEEAVAAAPAQAGISEASADDLPF
jgi:single-strand DNA-binding protein